MSFELIQFREPAFGGPGISMETSETKVGEFGTEQEAINAGRTAWIEFRRNPSPDVVWWTVRATGERLARWIADGHSEVERVLDLRTNQLVEVR